MLTFAPKQINLGMIFKLRELSEKDIREADEKLSKAQGSITVLDHQTDGIFDCYTVLSSEQVYEVIRLGYFVHCTCRNFEFGGGCKHIALTFPKMCVRCGEKAVPHRGDKCRSCFYIQKSAKKVAAKVFQ